MASNDSPGATFGEDRGESVSAMEPLLVSDTSRTWPELSDLAATLLEESAAFHSSLPEGISRSLANFVRAMNCYYSNLIEGHDTHPVDIERSLKGDYSDEPRQRELQQEARAHIAVQKWIDDGGLGAQAATVEGIRDIHKRFCKHLPDKLLWVEHPSTQEKFKVVPGALREHDVQVGSHIPISPGAVPRFLAHFESTFGRNLGKVGSVIAVGTAHHRLLWIHPFLDGNGRVARLMSYAMLREAVKTGGEWSVARGLARNEGEYKKLLSDCDVSRQNDYDGRGNLSEHALSNFAKFFLETCIDQVRFMRQLASPDGLRERILTWAREEISKDELPQNSDKVLEMILYRGLLERGDIAPLLNVGQRQARRVTAALQDREVIVADSARSPFYLAMPAVLAPRWMPGLYPAMAERE